MSELKSETKKTTLFVFFCVIINVFLFISINFTYNSNQYIRNRKNSPPQKIIQQETVKDINIYISEKNPENTYILQASSEVGFINKDHSLIRIEPNDEAQILCELNSGSEINITALDVNKSQGWTQVQIENKTGYIKTSCLTINYS